MPQKIKHASIKTPPAVILTELQKDSLIKHQGQQILALTKQRDSLQAALNVSNQYVGMVADKIGELHNITKSKQEADIDNWNKRYDIVYLIKNFNYANTLINIAFWGVVIGVITKFREIPKLFKRETREAIWNYSVAWLQKIRK